MTTRDTASKLFFSTSLFWPSRRRPTRQPRCTRRVHSYPAELVGLTVVSSDRSFTSDRSHPQKTVQQCCELSQLDRVWPHTGRACVIMQMELRDINAVLHAGQQEELTIGRCKKWRSALAPRGHCCVVENVFSPTSSMLPSVETRASTVQILMISGSSLKLPFAVM